MTTAVFKVGQETYVQSRQKVDLPAKWSKARILLPADLKVMEERVLPHTLGIILAQIEQNQVCLYSTLLRPSRPALAQIPEFTLTEIKGSCTAWLSLRRTLLAPHYIRSRGANTAPAFYERFNPTRFYDRISQQDVFLLLTRQAMSPGSPSKDVLAFAMIYCKTSVDNEVSLPTGIYVAEDHSSSLRGIPFQLGEANTRNLSITYYFFVNTL